MKIDLKKEPKKAAIISLKYRINLITTDVEAVQIVRCRNSLLDIYGRTVVDIVSSPHKAEEKALPYYKDISNTKLDEYDEVYIVESDFNFFGGVYPPCFIETFKQLCKFKGKIYYFLSDPRFPCPHAGGKLKRKFTDGMTELYLAVGAEPGDKEGEVKKIYSKDPITLDEVDHFINDIYPNIIVCFNGYDYDAYADQYLKLHTRQKIVPIPSKRIWCEFIFFEHFAIELFNDKSIYQNFPFEGKIYDLCYYGNNRRNERNIKIAELYKNPNHKKYFIGFDGVELENVTKVDRLEREDLFANISKNCISTIVIGDDLHNNNCITFRFYEAMMMDVAALIIDEYDTAHKLVQNEFLKDFIYVKSEADVTDRIARLRADESLYRKIVELEREEVKRLVSQYNINIEKIKN